MFKEMGKENLSFIFLVLVDMSAYKNINHCGNQICPKQKHQNHTSEKGQDPDFPQPEDQVGLSSPHGRLLLWDHLS